MDDRIKELIIRDWKHGITIQQMVKIYHYTRPTITQILTDAGQEIPKGTRNVYDDNRIMEVYDSGLRVEDISKQFGISYPTIYKILHRHGRDAERERRKTGTFSVIADLQNGMRVSEVARKHKISRQRVSFIKQKWDKREEEQ